MENLSQDIRDAHMFTAQLITSGHTVYLPLFERLEKEVQKLDEREQLIIRAKSITQNPTRDNQLAF